VSEGRVPLAPWLVGFAVAVLLAEVVVRRFFSAPRLRKPAVAATPRPAEASAGVAPSAMKSAPVARQEAPREAPATTSPSEPKEPPPPDKSTGGVDSALEAARARSRKRLGR
jgi:hypothetical protein